SAAGRTAWRSGPSRGATRSGTPASCAEGRAQGRLGLQPAASGDTAGPCRRVARRGRMLIRQTPWEEVASGPGTPSPGRFTAPGRSLWFWVVLWLAAIGAEFGALVPVLFDSATPLTGI